MTERAVDERYSAGFPSETRDDLTCPNCNGRGMETFYSVKNIPVRSCKLVSSLNEALDYPRGDLTLGFCPSCGFIGNSEFDEAVEDYDDSYEETQGFSPRFNTFAESLAKRLIETYDIRNKSVLEIGCGKGEFLVLMSLLGNNHGTGIDPTYIPGRLPEDVTARLNFIRDYYDNRYTDLTADFIACRHALEHIAPTYDFLSTVRESADKQQGSLIFFEVPDVLRVLKEGAFWDIYYEHCSYFSAGSLARLFRSLNFDLLDLSLDFDDQYLILMARPSSASAKPSLALENDLNELGEAVAEFRQTCGRQLMQWRAMIEDTHLRGGKTVLWGSGSKGVAFLTTLNITDQIEYVVDINPHRHGKFMPGTGQKILSPEELAAYAPDRVIAMNPIYRSEIQADLDRLGIKAELLAV